VKVELAVASPDSFSAHASTLIVPCYPRQAITDLVNADAPQRAETGSHPLSLVASL
jgi:hypothetical protein